MKINKAYKFRLYPTQEQELQFRQNGGNTRYIWNYFLNLNQEEYKKNKKFIFANKLISLLPELKKEEGKEFLNLSIAQSLQQVGYQFDKALKDFIKHTHGFPKWKKKSNHKDGFIVPQYFKIYKTSIYIPKIGKVRWKKNKVIKGKIKSIVIKQDGEQWYVSVCCELKIKKKEKYFDNIIGIDVGIKTYATHSDGEKTENPKILKKWEKKLKKEQRKLNKTLKGGKNREKQRKRVAKIHQKIRNIRKDFLHKETTNTIAKCDCVIVEDLNVSGMMRNHCLAKCIQDCSWNEYTRQLKYKALWNNKTYIEIGRFEPTSKTCSNCGWKNDGLTLKDREFKCEKCDLDLDRDLNAAVNIKEAGIRILRGTQEFKLWGDKKLQDCGPVLVKEPRIKESKSCTGDICSSIDYLNPIE